MSYGVRRLTVFAAVGAVAVHLYVTPPHLQAKPHLGVLLLVGSALLGYAAVQLVRRGDLLAWRVGAVVSAGMVVGFFVSRTGGVPDEFREAGWEAPFGPLALLFKGCYLMLFMVATRRLRRAEGYIRGEPSAGGSPWSALDAHRRRGGRIDWDDWFRVWNDITGGQRHLHDALPAAERRIRPRLAVRTGAEYRGEVRAASAASANGQPW